MKVRKFILLILSLTIAFNVCSCGGDGGSETCSGSVNEAIYGTWTMLNSDGSPSVYRWIFDNNSSDKNFRLLYVDANGTPIDCFLGGYCMSSDNELVQYTCIDEHIFQNYIISSDPVVIESDGMRIIGGGGSSDYELIRSEGSFSNEELAICDECRHGYILYTSIQDENVGKK